MKILKLSTLLTKMHNKEKKVFHCLYPIYNKTSDEHLKLVSQNKKKIVHQRTKKSYKK